MNPKRSHAEIGLSQTNRMDRTTIIHLQQLYKLHYNQAKRSNNLKHYKKIKYDGIIYKIGEFIQIYHLGSNHNYVAKLVDIAAINKLELSEDYDSSNIDLKCPLIEVEWYYRKTDLSRDPKYEKQWKNIISDSEVFASGITLPLPVEAIVCKCQVLTIKQYYHLSMVEGSIYFSRASYNAETETLTPRVEDWQPKYCVCEKPYNPDMGMIECEKCRNWFHSECVIKEGVEVDNFVCRNCFKKETATKKKKK